LPDSLEFSRLDAAMIVTGVKYVKLENLHFTHYEDETISENGGWNGYSYDSSNNIYISNCSFDYVLTSVFISHGTVNANSLVHDWHIDHCSFTHNDASALKLYSDGTGHFPNVGIVNFWVTNCYFYHLGFGSERNVGISVGYVKNFYFLNNTVKYVAHNGLQMSYSASKGGEVSTGYSLFRGNLFDSICSGNSDCGCLKFWSVSDSHIWKNILVTENLCQNTFGWTKTSYNRDQWRDRGYGGFGFFTDYVSGPVFYRNIVYNVGQNGFNIYKEWEEGNQTTVVNNLIVGSMLGVVVGGAVKQQTSHITVKNNVFLDTAVIGLTVSRTDYPTPFEKFDVNNNLYYRYGWVGTKYNAGICVIQDSTQSWGIAPTFEALHNMTPDWETTEYSFDPQYGDYPNFFNLSYDERHQNRVFEDGTFDVTSPLIDKGTDKLPQIVTELLEYFKIDDVKKGSRYDLGPYESGVRSWIPSSKEVIVDVPSSSDPSHGSINSATALRIPLWLVAVICFFSFVQ